MKKINNLTENFEDELETLLRDEGIIDENGMVYADHVIAAQPFSSKDEKVEFVENECISFVDDEYIYICKNDGIGDYGVERVLITKHSELLSLLEEEDEDAEEFEPYNIYYKVVSNRNEQIYVEGYATINDCDVEDEVDWYHWDGSQYISQIKILHDGIEITGATVEQENEIAQFESDLADDGLWIDDVILQSDDTENRTYVRENLTLIINDGAKMECTINEDIEKDSMNEYFFEVIPYFNGEKLYLAKFIQEKYLVFDPYGVGDDNANFFIEDGRIFIEISKDWFEDDAETRMKEMETFINPEMERIYARYLVSNLCVFGIVSRLYEEKYGKMLEGACDKFASIWEQAFEDMPVNELYTMSEEDVERIMEEEGY